MKNQIETILINEDYLKDKIYIIRGQKVMLDSDLAKIYGYSTKAFNQQVQRNIDKFDEDFMFQLKEEEIPFSSRSQFATTMTRSQNVTTIMQTKGVKGGRVYKPFVFTESGIYMLMTVLKGPLAITQSKALIRTFKAMKDYIIENRELISNNELELRTQLLERDVKDIKEDNKEIKMGLKRVMDNFIDPSTYKHYLILDGMKLEADNAYVSIFKQAKKSIIYIDNYIGIKTLELLSYARNGVAITIISDNKAKPPINQNIVNDFIHQNKTNSLMLLKAKRNHDRYIIIDFGSKNEMIYHCGASLKDAGNKITTIMKVEDSSIYKKTIKEMLKSSILRL